MPDAAPPSTRSAGDRSGSPAPGAPAALRYRLSVPRPEAHLVEVELRAPAALAGGGPLRLEMASWCPGSYLIRDYARYVRDLEAAGGDGRPLAARQVSKREWEIDPAGADEVVVRYRVYGRELSVRTNHIDGGHAFLHGPAVYLFPEAARGEPVEVAVAPPDGRAWPIVTALAPRSPGDQEEAAAGRPARFRAADVDELLDSPIHIGPVELRSLRAGGRPVTLAVWGREGEAGPFGLDDLVRDLGLVIDAHAARLGDLPCESYTFILMLSPGAYGGLEHRSSSANLNTPFAFASAKGYHELVELLSHELFHVWNGKRLHPQVFERFDYGRENYTRCLWVVEGITSYFDRLALRRAGVITPGAYLSRLVEEWGRMLAIPGRRRHSLEDASLNAWVKLYRPDESNVNTTVSYYLKGSLVMAALDLELRRRSRGEVDLDRVLVHMWRAYGAVGRGYPEEVQPIFEEATGLSLGDFFDRVIRGRQDPDLGGALAAVGLELVPGWDAVKPEEVAAGARPPVWLGVVPGQTGRAVAAVLEGGPADAAGLSPGDEIAALNRFQVSGESDLRQKLAGRAAGERIELAVFRRGRLAMLELELEVAPPTRYEVIASAGAGDLERALYRGWMGQDHPHSGAVIAAASVPGTL
ncbi:MAG TPA: PDZ domain-containing protein [Kofleriaceae bacterium]|nr:PDZ domain-containing protein [Kofleriaceae bacterium]